MDFLYTPYMKKTWQEEVSHDLMVYAYVQKFVEHNDEELTDRQIDRIFKALNETDKFELEPDEDIMMDLADVKDVVTYDKLN